MSAIKKRPVTGGMRVSAYVVLVRAVEEGIERGWRRAHKHTDKPEPEEAQNQIEHHVLDAVCEVFRFEDPEGT